MAPTAPELDAFVKYLAALAPEEQQRVLSGAKMRAAAATPADALRAPIRTARDYLNAEIEIPPVLIHPFMCVRGGLNVTVGRAGKGKTVMNLNRMIRWSAGLPMFDGWKDKDGNHLLAPDKPLKILIVENEGAAGMFHRQFGMMVHSEKYLSDEHREIALDNCFIWGEGGYSHLKLDDAAKLEELRGGIEEWKPDMVFIEPFRSLWSGEENSATEMNTVVDALVGIATDYDCGVWAAHHEKKGGAGEDDKMSAARGSTVLEGIVTVMENFESSGEHRELAWSKSRYELPPPPVTMEWDHEEKWYRHVPRDELGDEVIAQLMDNNDEPMSRAELSEALDKPQTKLKPILDSLKKEKKIVQMKSETLDGGRGSTGYRYRLSTSGDSNGSGQKGLEI